MRFFIIFCMLLFVFKLKFSKFHSGVNFFVFVINWTFTWIFVFGLWLAEGCVGAGLRTVLWVVVAGSGRSLIPVEPQQGEEGEERLSVTNQDGGRLRGRILGPVSHMIDQSHDQQSHDQLQSIFSAALNFQNLKQKFCSFLDFAKSNYFSIFQFQSLSWRKKSTVFF